MGFDKTEEMDGWTYQYYSIHQGELSDLSINRETYTPIDGHKSRVDGDRPCLFPIRDINIQLLIDRSIN